MRIVIDLQGAQSESRYRGIGRYSLAVSLAITQLAYEHEVWIVLNAQLPAGIPEILQAFEALVPRERIRFFSVPCPTRAVDPTNAWRASAAELIRESFIANLQPDAVLVTSLFEGYFDNATVSVRAPLLASRTAVILYDLIPYLNPSHYLANIEQRTHYERQIESLKSAGFLLAISEHSLQEAISALDIAPNKVHCVHTAVDSRFKPKLLNRQQASDLRARYGIREKFVMYAPGGFDPRKNFDGLIRAFGMLPNRLRSSHQLVIASKASPADVAHLQHIAHQSGLPNGALVLTGYVDDDELVCLYGETDLFVFPSLHEGFGLPALEAMTCGAAVIGSNSTSIPEVVGRSDALFNPKDPGSIAEMMERVLSSDTLQQELKRHGREHIKRFSWKCTAQLALEALVNLASGGLGSMPAPVPSTSSDIQGIAGIQIGVKPTDSDLVQVANCLAFNSTRKGPAQLFLDVSVIVHGDAKSGIQRVVRSLLVELLSDPPVGFSVKPIYFDHGRYLYANAFVNAFIQSPNSETRDTPVDFYQDDIYLALDLNAHLTAAVHNLHLHLANRGVRLFFVVYDILLVQHPEWWPAGTGQLFESWLKSISHTATGLICISEAVANEVRGWLSTNLATRSVPPMVRSFHLGADVENSAPSRGMPPDSEFVLAQLRARTTFLLVGTIEPRKGYAQTLDAFELLWSEGIDINLAIVGKQGWLMDGLCLRLRTHTELNSRLFWLEGISDEYLEQLYATSTCLLAASEGEGFGLPLIEAAQHELPVLARDLPVFREVAREHALYFAGTEPSMLASGVRLWLEAHQTGRAPASSSMPRLDWHQSCKQLLSAMELTSNVPKREIVTRAP